jgi:hypothetical protein
MQDHTRARPQSIRCILCGRHSRADARARPHPGEPQRTPAGSLAPRHADSHVGYSRLVAAYVTATSVPRAGLQPSCHQL